MGERRRVTQARITATPNVISCYYGALSIKTDETGGDGSRGRLFLGSQEELRSEKVK